MSTALIAVLIAVLLTILVNLVFDRYEKKPRRGAAKDTPQPGANAARGSAAAPKADAAEPERALEEDLR